MMEDTAEEEHLVRNLVLSVCDLKQNGEAPTERLLAAAITVGTRLYMLGGCNSRTCFADLLLLELEQMKWSNLATNGQRPGEDF